MATTADGMDDIAMLLATPRDDAPSTATRYKRIAHQMREAIRQQVIRAGDPIPSEHQLCRVFGVSRPTVRRAVDALVEEGMLTRRQGMGTFVAKLRLEQPPERVIGFTERMRRNGLTPSTRVLDRDILLARATSPDIASTLSVSANDRIFRISRLRLANDEPIVLETIHVPLERFPALDGIDLAQESLYRVFAERFQTEVTFLRESLEPVLLTTHEAALLHAQAGSPAMLARIVTFDQHHQPIEHSISLVRGDRCQYEIELSPGEASGERGWSLRQTQFEVGDRSTPIT
ncbi:MAG: GntR family transcriptional regulator [Thermomicrobiales bacterium]